MDIERARYLSSLTGRSALESLPSDWGAIPLNTLATRLRSLFRPDEAAALSEQLSLRRRAGDRLWHPRAMLSADGLQMATHPAVAARRAERLAGSGLRVADLTAGLGSDLWACVAAGIEAIGIERDPATALLGSVNTGGRVVRGDARRPPLELQNFAVVIDPSRRDRSGRRLDPSAFSPPWEVALELAASGRAAVVKGPPGIDHSDVPLQAEVEFVQLGRTLREAALWFGAGAKPGVRRAVLLPENATLSSDDQEGTGDIAAPGQFVFDPESCVTRAGLVRHLGARIGAALMDSQVAYLTGTNPVLDPLCATFEILEVLPFSLGRLKTRMRAGGWRATEIRRRAFPIEPDELRKLLGRQEGDEVTLLCTTIGGQRTVFVTRRVVNRETANGCRQ